MARLPRIVIPDQALHIIQRGNNRQPCFFADDDYHYYLDSLKEAAIRCGARVHAYVLMTNHVHLLLTPESAQAPSLLLQSVGRRYVRYVNHVFRRSGTLWEGRYKSTLIDSDRYLLTCSRYIELNPVRARMVDRPGDYPWSSFHSNAGASMNPMLSLHPIYLALGGTPESRALAYSALFDSHLDPCAIEEIREATETGIVLGNDRFREQVQSTLRRCVARQPHGGDRKSEAFRERSRETRR